MQTCTTEGVPIPSRTAAWTRYYGAHLEAATIMPREPEAFSARMTVGDLGPLRFARLTCPSTTIERSADQIGLIRERTYSFLLQIRGSSRLSHFGTSIALAAGDLTLCQSAAPYNLALGAEAELLILRVPATMLKAHLPSPETYCGRRLAGCDGLTATAAAMALSLFRQIEAGLASQFQERAARHLLDVIATSYGLAFDAPAPTSSIVAGRLSSVKLFIEQHLRDPDLSPSLIAARLKLSSRYLRMIFAGSNETVSAYILRRRLEECARHMADPSWRGHSITEIAFGWGFNSAPHFTRSFRDRFSMSPREYRRFKQTPEAVAA